MLTLLPSRLGEFDLATDGGISSGHRGHYITSNQF